MSAARLVTVPAEMHYPSGFSFAGVSCGLKRSGKRDLSLVVSDGPMTAAGVYTQNRICAAPVEVDRGLTPSNNIRAVVTNSGNANACTGDQGMRDAQAMLAHTASAIGCRADQVLVMSTGVIGVPLDMECIERGIETAATNLAADSRGFGDAAEAILTTDTRIKVAGVELDLDKAPTRVVGMAKGSGMIAPNMATMLGLMLTDAALTPDEAQAMLGRIVEQTFNRITVDGHMSTNDTVIVLTKTRDHSSPAKSLATFEEGLFNVCAHLSKSIVDDGEGASHRIDIEVTGCRAEDEAKQIALAVANSPLVKTAVAGGDPNWGRIVSAAGYAGPQFDPNKVRLMVNGFLLFEHGGPVPFDDPQVSRAMRDAQTVLIRLSFGEGHASARVQSADLTAEYVRINAEYRT